MDSLLERLWNWLVLTNPEVQELWQKGLSQAEQDEVARQHGITFPDEVSALYRWHNGVRENKSGSFFPDPRFFFRCYMNHLARAFEDDLGLLDAVAAITRTKPHTLICPLEDGHGGQFLVPYYEQQTSIVPVFYLAESGEFDLCFNGVQDMVLTIVGCYEKGVCWVDEDGFEQDDDAVASIGRELNPGMEFWANERGASGFGEPWLVQERDQSFILRTFCLSNPHKTAQCGETFR